jgi:hypothetical protein
MTSSRIDSQIFTPLKLGKQGIACRILGEGRRLSRRYIDTRARGSVFVEIDRDLAAALVEVNDPHGRMRHPCCTKSIRLSSVVVRLV